MIRAVTLALLLFSACTTEVHVDADQDGMISSSEACAAWCACSDDRPTCERECVLPSFCAEYVAHCVLEYKYEGDGCSARVQDQCVIEYMFQSGRNDCDDGISGH